MSYSHYINGSWTEVEGSAEKQVINPATGEVLQTIQYGGQVEAVKAIEAAHQAFEDWSQKPVYTRAGYLRDLADAIRKNSDALGRTLTSEVGKTLPESIGELNAAADQFEWYGEEVKRSAGDVIPNRLESRRHMTIRHPVGPVAAISPWNFPILLSSRKLAPALAAGCTVINRPASQAPLTMIEIFKLVDQIGFPSGVFNFIVGKPDEISNAFISDERIKKISFTGSLEVGRMLAVECAKEMKKISLELGGHSPFIILPDVPVDEAADMAVFAKYRNMGQVCISASRFYIHQSKLQQFEEEVASRVNKLCIGNGLDESTDVGPLFERKRVDDSLRFVEDIQAKGGKILCGGKQPEGETYQSGFFFEPTVASGITDDMQIMNEEPFAPILPIITFDTIEEVIQKANNTPYGLAAYVMTNNLRWSVTMAEKLEAGIIGINDCSPAAAQCPFGGMKKSGTGREGWKQGLEAYYETKYVSIGI